MNAFRFLSLLTVGFSLLVLVSLLNATQGRMEAEATRLIVGPEVSLEAGSEVEWTLNLGGSRVEEAWPAPQRQPRLFLVGMDVEGQAVAPIQGLADASVVVDAMYLDEDGPGYSAFVGGAQAVGVRRKVEGKEASEPFDELSFGPLWMSWEHELQIKAQVQAAAKPGATARLVLRGEPTKDYVAARSMARTLWWVFTLIAVAGFTVLMLTQPKESTEAGPPS